MTLLQKSLRITQMSKSLSFQEMKAKKLDRQKTIIKNRRQGL